MVKARTATHANPGYVDPDESIAYKYIQASITPEEMY